MQLSDDEIKTGSIIATWVVTVVGFVWRTSKFHSRVEAVETEVQQIKQSGLLTVGDHDTLQRLCRGDVDHKIATQAQTVAQVVATQSAIAGDIKDMAEVVTEMDKKLAVIFAKINKQ